MVLIMAAPEAPAVLEAPEAPALAQEGEADTAAGAAAQAWSPLALLEAPEAPTALRESALAAAAQEEPEVQQELEASALHLPEVLGAA
jgi:hypothetical protein